MALWSPVPEGSKVEETLEVPGLPHWPRGGLSSPERSAPWLVQGISVPRPLRRRRAGIVGFLRVGGRSRHLPAPCPCSVLSELRPQLQGE